MLGNGRDAKIGKDEDEDEDVIDAERVFDDVAGQKIEAVVVAFRFPDQIVKSERENNPDQAAKDSRAHAQLAVAPFETDQVDREREEDAEVKGDPKPNTRRHGAKRPMPRRPPQSQSAVAAL